MNNASEFEVTNSVTGYLNRTTFEQFTVKEQQVIQFGSTNNKNGIADIVLLDGNGHFIAIAECKSADIGITEEGKNQLKSYLSATDTRFGILAASANPKEWKFFENLRSNRIRDDITQSYFEKHVTDEPDLPRIQPILTKWIRRTIGLGSAFLVSLTLSVILLILLLAKADTTYQVLRVINGDTIEIRYKGTPTSVQLIGVDAPETETKSSPAERYGTEASDFIQDLLSDESVYLRFGETKRDKYGRLLAYLYRASDGIFVNTEVIREGYGRVETRFPFKHMERFQSYETRAQTDHKGIWRNTR